MDRKNLLWNSWWGCSIEQGLIRNIEHMSFENPVEKEDDGIELLPATPESEKQAQRELHEKEIAELMALGEENLNEGQKEYLKDLRARIEMLDKGR